MTGDIPKRLIKEYPYLWAGPTAMLFNKSIQNSEWPQTFKVEHAFPLHKTETPALVLSEDDVRTISKTNSLSKLLENLLGDWLLSIVEPYLDPGQCGGLRRNSINHYLIKLLDFIHTTIDSQIPISCLRCQIPGTALLLPLLQVLSSVLPEENLSKPRPAGGLWRRNMDGRLPFYNQIQWYLSLSFHYKTKSQQSHSAKICWWFNKSCINKPK